MFVANVTAQRPIRMKKQLAGLPYDMVLPPCRMFRGRVVNIFDHYGATLFPHIRSAGKSEGTFCGCVRYTVLTEDLLLI
jgi:hypothetical protein